MSDKPAEILQAARRLFSAKGYEATSVRDIAETVGLQPGSLYAHIDRKEDLLFEVIDEASERFLGEIGLILGDASLSPPERLNLAIRAHLDIVTNNLEAATVFFHEWRSLTGERRDLAMRKRRRYEAQFMEIISDGQRAGFFRAVDEWFASVGLLSVLNWTYTWFSPDGPMGAEELGDVFSALFMEGIADGHASGHMRKKPASAAAESEGATRGR